MLSHKFYIFYATGEQTSLFLDLVSLWVSEWLLFNANSVIFQLYHGENNLIFNEMMMMSTLY